MIYIWSTLQAQCLSVLFHILHSWRKLEPAAACPSQQPVLDGCCGRSPGLVLGCCQWSTEAGMPIASGRREISEIPRFRETTASPLLGHPGELKALRMWLKYARLP